LLISAVAGIGTHEYFGMARARGYEPQVIVGPAVSFGLCLALTFHRPTMAIGILVLGVLMTMGLDLRRNDPEGAIGNLGASLGGMIYVGVLLSHAILIRSYLGNDKLGILFMITALAGSMLCDTGAYFTGRAWGRRKLIPRISPGKTVVGTVGGFFTGIVAVVLVKAIAGMFMTVPFGWGEAVLLGALVSVAGIIGDLIVSMFKRDAGVKDSGKLFPGHGGAMDRLDALLWAIPVTYYFAVWMIK